MLNTWKDAEDPEVSDLAVDIESGVGRQGVQIVRCGSRAPRVTEYTICQQECHPNKNFNCLDLALLIALNHNIFLNST